MEAALVEPEVVKAEPGAGAGGAGEPSPPSPAPAAAPVLPPAPVGQDEEEVKPPAVLSDEQIVASLRALLATADMATTTGETEEEQRAKAKRFVSSGRARAQLPGSLGLRTR